MKLTNNKIKELTSKEHDSIAVREEAKQEVIEIIDAAAKLVGEHKNNIDTSNLNCRKYENIIVECPNSGIHIFNFFAETKNRMGDVVSELADLFYAIDIDPIFDYDEYEEVFEYLKSKDTGQYVAPDIFENLYDWLEFFLVMSKVEFSQLEKDTIYI